MRRGGRLLEWLTARNLAGRMKLTFAVHRDSLQLSLVVMFCNCQIVSKLPARHLCVVNHVCTSNIIPLLVMRVLSYDFKSLVCGGALAN